MPENNVSYEIAQEKASLSPEAEAVIQEVSSHISIDPEVLAQDSLETDIEYGEKIEGEFPFLLTIKPFLDSITLDEEGLKDVLLPNGYGRFVLDSKGNTPRAYVSSIALTLAMSELPVQTIASETNLSRKEKLGDIISEVHPTFDKDRKDMERILQLALTDKGKFLKEFKGEGRNEMYNMLRTKVALSALTAMMLSSCVLQEGVIVNLPSATKEPVPVTEIVDIPTETEVPATETPISTPTPIPTEEATIESTREWPASPSYYKSYMYGMEEFIQGHMLLFMPFASATDRTYEGIEEWVICYFTDFFYESLEITEEGSFLVGTIRFQGRENRGKLYPVRIKINQDNSRKSIPGSSWGETVVLTPNNTKEINKGRHYEVSFFVVSKEDGTTILTEQEMKSILTSSEAEEKWKEVRSIINEILEEGESSRYEFILDCLRTK